MDMVASLDVEIGAQFAAVDAVPQHRFAGSAAAA